MFVPKAPLPNPGFTDVIKCEPVCRMPLALLDIKAKVVIGHEEPFVVVDLGIGSLGPSPSGAVGPDGDDVSDSGFISRVEVQAGDEGNRA